MDNQTYINDLEKTYNHIDATNSELDHKSISMVMIIGTMLSLQASFLFPKVTGMVSVLCMVSLIGYSVALILFIKPLVTKKFKLYPNLKSVKECYELDVSDDEYYLYALGKYDDVIEFNMNQILVKGKYTWLGFYFLIFGVVFTVLTLLLMVVA